MIIIYVLEVVIAKMVVMMTGMVNMRTNVKLADGDDDDDGICTLGGYLRTISRST